MAIDELFKSAEEMAAITREQIGILAEEYSGEERAAFVRLAYSLIAADYLSGFVGDLHPRIDWLGDICRLAEERRGGAP